MSQHRTDDDCVLNNVGSYSYCIICKVEWGPPCGSCGGRGYHWADCAELAYELAVDAADREREG